MEEHRAAGRIGCSLESEDGAARRLQWQSLRARAAMGAVPTTEGLRLSFRADPGVEEELRELVPLELDCCSFADWSLQPENGQLVLSVSAGGDGVRALQEWFGIRSEPGPSSSQRESGDGR